MMDIGIDSGNDLVYEGKDRYGHVVWPSPFIPPAKIVFEAEGLLKVFTHWHW